MVRRFLPALWRPTVPAAPPPPWAAAQGWRRRGDRLVGAFRAGERRYQGEIRFDDDGSPVPFIRLPAGSPSLRGSHAACFFPTIRPGVFRVHFAVMPLQNSVDDAIRAVEAVLR